jgi:hypothetical protein
MSYTSVSGGRPEYSGYIADEASFRDSSRWSGLTQQNHLASVFSSFVAKKSDREYNWNLQYTLTPGQVFSGTRVKVNLKRRKDER